MSEKQGPTGRQIVNTGRRARKRIDRSTWLGAGILAAFLIGAVMLHWKLNIGQQFSAENIDNTVLIIRTWAARFGIWGPVLFIAAGSFALLVTTPAAIIIYLSVILFGYATAGVTSMLAILGGTTLIYFAGQALGRPFVLGLFGNRLTRLEERFLNRELMNVIYFRLIFLMSPWMNWLLCVSGVRYRNLMLGTLLGIAHHVILSVWFGGLVINSVQSGRSLNPVKSPQLLLPVAIGLVIFVVLRSADMIYRRRRISNSG